MSSSIIPKERLTAYQRWEMGSFDPSATAEEKAAVALPTAAQLEKIHQQAREEGFAAGYEEGRQQALAEATRLRQILAGLTQAMAQADQTLCNDLLVLSLDLAKQMVRQALQVRPELALTVVQESIRCLPSVGQPARLFLHPDDADLVRRHMAEELSAWTICPDPHLARGGCRIETTGGEIDATLPTRWRRIASALGQNSQWLE